MYFTYEIDDSCMKINFACEILISRLEFEHFRI